jgi:HEAT repeat protein
MKDLNETESKIRFAAAQALIHIKPGDLKQRDAIVTALLKDLDEKTERDVRFAAAQALGHIKPDDPKQRDAIVAALLKNIDEKTESNVRFAAVRALNRMKPEDPKQRDAIVTALLNHINKVRSNVDLTAAVQELGQVKPDDPKLRDEIVYSLLQQLISGQLDVRRAAAAVLFAFGPIGPDQILELLKEMHDDAPSRTGFWRARAIAFAGPVTSPDAAWVFLHFMGRPIDSSIPWSEVHGKPVSAIAYLKHIDANWPALAGSDPLQREVADRVLDIAEHACPSAAQRPSDRAWYARAFDLVRHEAAATWKWIAAATKVCWTEEQRKTLVSLQSHIQSAGLKTNAALLAQGLKSDTAAPAFGLLLTGYFAWAVPFLGLITAFPHSARVRALYLYNDKVRNCSALDGIRCCLLSSPSFASGCSNPSTTTYSPTRG